MSDQSYDPSQGRTFPIHSVAYRPSKLQSAPSPPLGPDGSFILRSTSHRLLSASTPSNQVRLTNSLSGGPPVPPKPIFSPYTPIVRPQTSRNANNSDGTFNNSRIPTGVSAPRPNSEQIIVTSPCGAHASPFRLYGHKYMTAVLRYLSVTLPTQIYLLFLLQLPSLYSSRVDCIFEEVDMTLPEIEGMVLKLASQGLKGSQIEKDSESSPVDKKLASTWRSFIDSVTREWKIFNIISVLLSSTILAILQIEGAAQDPLTRFTALFSLICALISLLFGCMYMVRFDSMRETHKAVEWAEAAKKTKRLIWWNVRVMLAMPVIWLTWSIMLYIVCIMSFVWRSGVTNTAPPGISNTDLLAIRITITVVVGIGMVYGILIMTTLRQYGVVMDIAWKQRIGRWIEKGMRQAPSTTSYGHRYASGSTILPIFYH